MGEVGMSIRIGKREQAIEVSPWSCQPTLVPWIFTFTRQPQELDLALEKSNEPTEQEKKRARQAQGIRNEESKKSEERQPREETDDRSRDRDVRR